MKKYTMFTFLALIITGCATTYQAPVTQSKIYTGNHNSSKGNLMAKAKKILLLEGFQIQSTDDEAGYISTSLKNWKLAPEEASCGTTMGLDYLKDKRTKTEVAFNVIIDETTISIRSNIQGEYKPGAVDQDITLTCVSKGVIEKKLAQKISN